MKAQIVKDLTLIIIVVTVMLGAFLDLMHNSQITELNQRINAMQAEQEIDQ